MKESAIRNPMPLALNGSTIMTAPQEAEIEAAARAGFRLLELRAPKLREFVARHSIAELADLLKRNNVRPLSINSLERATMRPPTEWRQVEGECRELAALAGEIGCEYLLVIPGPAPPGASAAEIRQETTVELRSLADLAAMRGVRLGFEFLAFAWCSVRDLEQAAEIIAEVGRPDVGLVVDTCHLYASGSTLEVLDQIEMDKLFILHVNDCPEMPRSAIEDHHRVMPGRGVIPLKEIWRRLRARGYRGPVSVELFHPEYWKRDPEQVALEAHQAAEAIFG